MLTKFFLILISLTAISCASVNKIGKNQYQAKCEKIFRSCTAEMEKTCPMGYKVMSKDWVYEFGGVKDIFFFQCKEKV